jgi:hypothetical protein
MAAGIDINSVYKAVLVILEQEKRGVLLPVEFNKIATQAQQEIFTEYFDELNQVLRMPQTSLAYADRLAMLDEKISLFKRSEEVTLDASQVATIPAIVQELGSVIYNSREVQRIQPFEVYTTNASPLTAPTEFYPVYTYENQKLKLYPNTVSGDIILNYLKYPADVKWGFTIDKDLGNYVYNASDSVSFDVHRSDQPLLVAKILGYAGVMTKDQFAMSIANQKEQQINSNSQK